MIRFVGNEPYLPSEIVLSQVSQCREWENDDWLTYLVRPVIRDMSRWGAVGLPTNWAVPSPCPLRLLEQV